MKNLFIICVESFLIFALIISTCGANQPKSVDSVSTATSSNIEKVQWISRDQVMKNAALYADHIWTPMEKNFFHGEAPDGKRVDTPDAEYSFKAKKRKGGWVAGIPHKGLPYQWGGYSSIETFESGIAEGKYAGDIHTKKRGRSKYAVGLDCSGYVSRCWELKRKQSTRGIPRYCIELEDPKDIKKGDIMNHSGSHVVIFDSFTDDSMKELNVYEATVPGVIRKVRNLEKMLKKGYKPLRYKYITN
jgi:hypothetical protein